MNGWNNTKIGNIIENLFDGPHATPQLAESGPIFLGIKNITEGGKLDLTDIRHISNEDYIKWTKRVTPTAGDIVFSYEATLHRYAIIPQNFKGCLGRRMALIRVNPTKTNVNYLFYSFFTKKWRDEVDKYVISGSTVNRIPLTNFPNFEITIPDFNEQCRIASLISAYDELIENNQKRIKILEEMAQRLYTQWFVKFKFPGHENIKLVDSGTEYGMIPEGWEVKKLSEIANIVMGQSPESAYYNEEGIGLPFHQGVKDFTNLYPVNRVFSSKGNRFAEKGDLLFSVRAPVGKMNISECKIIIGRGLCAIRHKADYQSYLISAFLNRFTEKDMLGNGAIYKSINKNELTGLKFINPDRTIVDKFDDLSSKLLNEIELITKENNMITPLRNLLIENLVTGKRQLKE
jgi:type I restriction enzyme S subunit